MSRVTARTVRTHKHTFSRDLVLLDLRKSTFRNLTVSWNFNVLEMALKTFHFVQGPSRTPLLFIPRYLTNIFFEHILQIEEISKNRKYENLKNRSWKVKVSSFVSAGTVVPTPPHQKWRFRKCTGRFHLLIWPWPNGGGARPWPSGAGGEECGAGSGPPVSGSGPGPILR